MIYFDNAYRMLGLFDNATRGEARAVFHQLKIRSKLAGGTGPADPLMALAPAERTEDGLRDAFNALGNVTERLRQRLCWFSKRNSRDQYALDCMASGDYKGAVEAWGTAADPATRANLARLYHALTIARDLLPQPESGPHAIPESYTWIDSVRVWREVLADDKFWDELAGVERASGFEPIAFGADFASLRANAWEILLEPSFILLTKLAAAGEYGKARDHIEDLRDAGLPAPNITDLEKDGFSMVASGVDATIDEISVAMEADTQSGVAPIRVAYERYRAEVLPTIREMLRLAGYNFEPSRQLCESCADFLQMLAERASAAGSGQYALALQSEGRAMLKGVIESEKRPAASSTAGSNYRPTGAARAERSSKSNIPAWVVVKVILILIGLGVRAGSCDGRGSRYSSGLVTDGAPYSMSQSSTADPDTMGDYGDENKYEDTSNYVAMRGDPEILRDMQNMSFELKRRESSLLSLAHRMDDANDKVRYLDSEVVATGTRDTIMRNITRRAVKPWLKIYTDRWAEFDTLYKSYQEDLATFNSDLRKLPKSAFGDGKPPKKEVAKTVRAAYAGHKQSLGKWRKLYGTIL